MTTVAVLSFRLGAADGVSVAAAQWVVVLRRLGCQVRTVAGAGIADRLVPGLAFDAPRPAHCRDVEEALRGVREWARVMRPGAALDIGVPDARFVAEQWVRGEIDTAEANYWILGGHSDRAAHQGVDARGVPRWIWNAHHTMFDAESLRALVSRCLALRAP